MIDNSDPKVNQLLRDYWALNDDQLRAFHLGAQHAPPPPESDPWHPFTLAEAYQQRPPIEYIAGNLLELPSLNIVYGAPGTLKSFLLADLLICAAGGTHWLEPAPWQPCSAGFQTKKVPVMWCDFDNGRRRTHDRFGALGRAYSLPVDTPLVYYSMPDPWLLSTDKASIGELGRRIKDRGIKLVCIDNLGTVLGDAEENSGEMAQVMSHFRQLAEDTGAAVVLVHHQRKSNGMSGRAGDTLRGHSSIEAALDLALRIDREPYAETIDIKATKVRGADVLPFRAQFTFENNEREELYKARFYGLGTEDQHSSFAIEREVLQALAEGQKKQNELVSELKDALPEVGANRIRDALKRMTSDGKIRCDQGSHNAKVYSV